MVTYYVTRCPCQLLQLVLFTLCLSQSTIFKLGRWWYWARSLPKIIWLKKILFWSSWYLINNSIDKPSDVGLLFQTISQTHSPKTPTRASHSSPPQSRGQPPQVQAECMISRLFWFHLKWAIWNLKNGRTLKVFMMQSFSWLTFYTMSIDPPHYLLIHLSDFRKI